MKDFLLDLKVFLNCAFESGFRKSGAFIENDNVEKYLYCLLDSFDTYDGFFDKSKFIIFYTNS